MSKSKVASAIASRAESVSEGGGKASIGVGALFGEVAGRGMGEEEGEGEGDDSLGAAGGVTFVQLASWADGEGDANVAMREGEIFNQICCVCILRRRYRADTCRAEDRLHYSCGSREAEDWPGGVGILGGEHGAGRGAILVDVRMV